MKKLVLFDIDGTLLRVELSRRSLIDALIKILGTDGDAMNYNMAGKLDSVIIRDCMMNAGVSSQEIEKQFPAVKKKYIEYFTSISTPSDVTLMPGVVSLLEVLSKNSDIVLGLLTGNFEESGRHKLTLGNIEHYFPLGAFAEDSDLRDHLPPYAVERAHQQFGKKFVGKDVIIIGDTKHDISCARTLQSKSICVATGHYPLSYLLKYNPDAGFDDFSDTAMVVEEILR